ncbi:GNAT family N-acetyltransferase [Paenibacillus chitinolyticus]|uniref:GNAT family N-acetyltransferase n=1 Tax=Paenibacillus chitinolyticus TaxID=79263 RepID=UPI0035DB3371
MNIQTVFAQLPVLESSRLVLKKIGEDNLDEVFDIYDNEEVFRHCGIIPKHNKETVRSMIGHFERDFGKKSRIKWGIFRKEDGRMTGIAEAFDFNQKVDMVTIGYFLAEDCWGMGIATEAVRLLTAYLFTEAEVNRIQAEVMLANDVSKKVLIKNGFRKEGTLRQAALWSGKGIIDLEIYAILKEDYDAAPDK